jgi:phosphate butyryltransferase
MQASHPFRVSRINPNGAYMMACMEGRGQVLVDGRWESLVAGQAEVLIVPNLEAGNMLAKELTFVARAEAAGIVAGAKAPVILTSRSDNDRARLASCAVAQLYDYWREHGEALKPVAPLARAAE